MTHALVITDVHGERRIPLVGTLVVGRDPGCEIYDPDPLLSRRHAQFVLGAKGASVRDLDSRNGIQVNGSPVKEAPLRPGDVVQIAHLRIRYEESLPEPAAAPPSGSDDATVVVPDAMMELEAAAAAGPQTGGAEATRVVLPPALNLGQPVARPAAPAAVPAPARPPAPVELPTPPAPAASRKKAKGVVAAASTDAPAEAREARGPWVVRVQIYFAVVAIAAFLIAALPALWWHDSQLSGFAEERASTLANWAAAEARVRLEANRPVGDALDDVLKQPGVVSALVLSPDGRVLAPAIRSQEVVDTLEGLGVKSGEVFRHQIGHAGDLTIAARPVQAGDRPRAAVVWLSVRASDLGARVESSGAVLAPMFVVAILMGIAMALLLHRSTTRVLGALNEDTELAMAGQIRTVADTLGSAPTRDLATTLNYLLARIRAGGDAPVQGESPAPAVMRTHAPAVRQTTAPAPARQAAPAAVHQPASASSHAAAPEAVTPPPPVVPALPPAQLVASAQLRVTEASDTCGAVFGVPRDTAIGQHVLDAISEKAVLDAVLKCLSAMPASGRHEATAVHEATGKMLRIGISRAGRDQPVTIEAREEA